LLELLEYCATFMRFKAEEKQQNIEVSGEIIPALVNRDQIWRVVNNLLNNAIKFSPLGTTIYVKVHKEGKEAIVSIKDQGIGMPEDMKDKVFNMFAGAGRSGTSGEKTFGLGLPICKQIMDAHKGKIWFESKEGKGSTFFLSFPL
ncbi:MAG: HAMP domain-containing histidine kinase, partial [Bacteroidota bacterium]|nr:HAMP domain-containing histidine kinase [Bacteroidota bacterium]MDX5430479.1 HAMP domain-containing histidine kinase [Bacteroidota bacterium]MDX5469240.1 HAMP domain-containing histidine kinase [Bacteroidota bacterium]